MAREPVAKLGSGAAAGARDPGSGVDHLGAVHQPYGHPIRRGVVLDRISHAVAVEVRGRRGFPAKAWTRNRGPRLEQARSSHEDPSKQGRK